VNRESLKNTSRIVVKLGTGILTDTQKRLAPEKMEPLVEQIARQRLAGKEIVVVTSGAIGAGMGILGYDRRPTDLAELQACAAVGQSQLMGIYTRLFAKHGLKVAQVLLTHEDLADHDRHLNARNTLVKLLEHGVVPIVNENDVVSFAEIKVGDNDTLSALVACLLPADLLVILTTAEGLIEGFGTAHARLISQVDKIDSQIERIARGTNSPTAVGGMITKIKAARIVTRAGIPLVIATGYKPGVLDMILNGEEVGTLFNPSLRKLKSRKRWIAFFHHPKGTLVVDDGAKVAIREKGKSLLPPGIVRVEGEFKAGEVVRVCDLNGTEFARGLVKFSAQEIRSGTVHRKEVIHRDDLVVL